MDPRICCFSGHRRLPGGEIPAIQKRLRDELLHLIEEGVLVFRAGGALGFDTLAAEAVLSLKGRYPGIRLVLLLPCRDQTRGWQPRDAERYRRILSRADRVAYLYDAYVPGCMQARNRALTEGADVAYAI